MVPRRLQAVGSSPAKQTVPRQVDQEQDRVEISQLARMMGKIAQLPPVRQDKIDQVKAAIASGSYETPDKWDIAIDRLLEEL